MRKIIIIFASLLKESTGEMAEWSIAAVLKTVDCHRSGGSNPSLSANIADYQQVIRITPNSTPKNVELGVLFFISILSSRFHRYEDLD